MPENIFQCIDEKNNQELCRNCGSLHFKRSESNYETILCFYCSSVHKRIQQTIKSAGEILDGMLDFAKRHGE